MKRFCPSCGKSITQFYEGLCKDCFFRLVKVMETPSIKKLEFCPICSRVKEEGGEWKIFPSKAEMVEEVVKKSVSLKRPVQLSVRAEKFTVGEKKIVEVPVKIKATLDIEGKKLFVEDSTKVILKVSLCNIHSGALARSRYYEAMIQLRGSEKVVKQMIEELFDRVERATSKSSLSFVSQVKKVIGGVDVNIGSRSVAEDIAGELKKIYGLEMKRTFSAAGTKAGKRLYRETILLRSHE